MGAFESDEIRATIFPPSPKSSTAEFSPSADNSSSMVQVAFDEDIQEIKRVMPLLELTEDGWTSGIDSIITPRRTNINYEHVPPSASGRLGYQGLQNSTSAPTIASRRDRSPSPERSAIANSPRTPQTEASSKPHSRQHSKVSFELPRSHRGSPSNRAQYDSSRISVEDNLQRIERSHHKEPVNYPHSQAFSLSSRATGESYSSSDRSRPSPVISEMSTTNHQNGKRTTHLQEAVRFTPVSSPEIVTEPTKRDRHCVKSEVGQILSAESYSPDPVAKHEHRFPEKSWYRSPTIDTTIEEEFQTPESALNFPVGMTMDDLNNLLDNSIKGQSSLNRASSMYERNSLTEPDSPRRSRSVSPEKHLTTPDPSPDRSPGRQAAEDYAESLRTKPLPQTPEQRQKIPSKQMFGEKGWLNRDLEVVRVPSQKVKSSGLKGFANRVKQRAEEKVWTSMKLRLVLTCSEIRVLEENRQSSASNQVFESLKNHHISHWARLWRSDAPVRRARAVAYHRRQRVPYERKGGWPHAC